MYFFAGFLFVFAVKLSVLIFQRRHIYQTTNFPEDADITAERQLILKNPIVTIRECNLLCYSYKKVSISLFRYYMRWMNQASLSCRKNATFG